MENPNIIPNQNEGSDILLKEWMTPLVVEIEILANNPFAEDGHPLGS